MRDLGCPHMLGGQEIASDPDREIERRATELGNDPRAGIQIAVQEGGGDVAIAPVLAHGLPSVAVALDRVAGAPLDHRARAKLLQDLRGQTWPRTESYPIVRDCALGHHCLHPTHPGADDRRPGARHHEYLRRKHVLRYVLA